MQCSACGCLLYHIYRNTFRFRFLIDKKSKTCQTTRRTTHGCTSTPLSRPPSRLLRAASVLEQMANSNAVSLRYASPYMPTTPPPPRLDPSFIAACPGGVGHSSSGSWKGGVTGVAVDAQPNGSKSLSKTFTGVGGGGAAAGSGSGTREGRKRGRRLGMQARRNGERRSAARMAGAVWHIGRSPGTFLGGDHLTGSSRLQDHEQRLPAGGGAQLEGVGDVFICSDTAEEGFFVLKRCSGVSCLL